MKKQTDVAAILSLSPLDESGMRRVFRLLPEIETQKASGVTYSRMAEALGLEPAHFRVYLFRAKKRALNSKTVDGDTRATSSASVTSPAAKPVAEPDLTTTEDRRAAQASRFNPMTDDDFPRIFASKSSTAFANADLPHIKKKDK